MSKVCSNYLCLLCAPADVHLHVLINSYRVTDSLGTRLGDRTASLRNSNMLVSLQESLGTRLMRCCIYKDKTTTPVSAFKI